MDHNARIAEGADSSDAERLPDVRDFLADLLTATVVTREGASRPLQWQRQSSPGRIEYQTKIRAEGRALWVTVGTDQELSTPIVRVQVRGSSRTWQPNRMDKVLEVFDLDVERDTETRERFNILRQSIASQVATNERQRNVHEGPIVEMRVDVTAETASIMAQYFSSAEDEEEEGEEGEE